MKLELNHISKAYGKTKALTDFNAVLEPGVYALLGPNGSGKSTLMNIITDNLKADKGEIVFDGQNVKSMGVRFREKIGFMPQYPGLYPNFTAREFLFYMATLKDIPKKDMKDAVEAVLSAVELSDVAGQKISSFSGGMKQRLALAQATLGDPEIIILDEPTAGLDPKQRISVRNYISSIALKKIVIIATHVVSDIEFIAKDAIILKKGVVIDDAPPAELARKMENKVWNLRCMERDVVDYESQYRVTSIAKAEDDFAELRVLSEMKPTETAEMLSPALEDYYLSIFGQIR